MTGMHMTRCRVVVVVLCITVLIPLLFYDQFLSSIVVASTMKAVKDYSTVLVQYNALTTENGEFFDQDSMSFRNRTTLEGNSSKQEDISLNIKTPASEMARGNPWPEQGIADIVGSHELLRLDTNQTFVPTIPKGSIPSDIAVNRSESKKLKVILLWNSHFGKVDFGFGLGEEPFKTHGCFVHSCFMTTDRNLVSSADAIVFHGFQTHAQDMPPRSSFSQIWIFYNMESPQSTKLQIKGTNDRYNLTFTYLDDPQTDIQAGIRRLKHAIGTDFTEDLFYNKSKLVAWAVSNCDASSQRRRYYEELAKYISTDVYGVCGNLSCPKSMKFDCFTMIQKDYLFYLAFENSFCRGYSTEKVFRTLRRGIIPIVLGGGDYAKELPPKSVIDVRDFNSPKHLAEYLLYLSRNATAYMEYFRWKSNSKIYQDYQNSVLSKTQGFCKLCSILHNDTYPYKTNFNVEEYWGAERLCLSRQEEANILHLNLESLD